METSEEVEELLELLVELLEEEELLEELEVVLKLLEVVVFEELEELEGVEELEEELEDAELEVEDIAVQTLLPSRSCVFGGHTQRVPVVRVRILLPGQGASEVEVDELLAIVVLTQVVSGLQRVIWRLSPSSTRRKFGGQMQVPSLVATWFSRQA